ncbi:NAD(P)-binding domain-containing protein, partial [Corynebacterium matruchotii]|uniref:NAD(P)-binding domain-containing protein n=1 Tax=Corynebacterium matruchotii TaxID=43768 RepID=UPI0036F1E544
MSCTSQATLCLNISGTLEDMKIAFLGTGRMGTELAKHLIANNDYEVRVWNRTLDKTTPLVDAGATAYPTAAEAVTG